MSSRCRLFVMGGILLLFWSSLALAKFPLTKAFVIDPSVNVKTLGGVDVCVDALNRVHVVWAKEPKIASNGHIRLYYRCFDETGKPLTEAIELTPPFCGAAGPSISSNSAGQIIVAAGVKQFEPYASIHSYWRLDSLGQVTSRTTFGLDQEPITYSPLPAAAVSNSGQVVIAFNNLGINNGDSLYYSMYDEVDQQVFPTHAASSTALQISTAARSKIDMSASGLFVIAWSAYLPFWPFYYSQPFARVFDAAGNPMTDEIPVACEGYPESCSGDPAYFLDGGASGQYADVGVQDNGDFAVAYRKDYDSDCATEFYMLRRFHADGTPKGPNAKINDKSNCYQYVPTVRLASDSEGNLVSVFLVNSGPGEDRWDVFAQRFDRTGKRVFNNYRLNDIPARYPNGAVDLFGADANDAGLLAAAWWETGSLADGWNLALQIMDVSDIGYKCGDANDDKTVDVSDAVYLITYIFSQGYGPKDICLGDASGDGVVDISDVVSLITYIFQEGSLPSNCEGH